MRRESTSARARSYAEPPTFIFRAAPIRHDVDRANCTEGKPAVPVPQKPGLYMMFDGIPQLAHQ